MKGNDIRPDAQAFDEVRIVTVPRFKDSELSGCEWRISAVLQLFRKGVLIWERQFRDVESACGHAYSVYSSAIDLGKAFFASEKDFCDQEGCARTASVFYQKKANYSREGVKTDPFRPTIRQFCERHRVRGDGALDDADTNYVELI